MTDVPVGTCTYCGLPSVLTVPADVAARVEAWLQTPLARRPFVQQAFRDLSPDQREQLINGTHGPCFDAMFPDDEED